MAERYQDKDNTGHLFRNDKKELDKHPDFVGHVMVNGKRMRVSGWTRVIQNGEKAGRKYLSLSFTEPWVPPPRPQAPARVVPDEGLF